jgi:hypothetical protein
MTRIPQPTEVCAAQTRALQALAPRANLERPGPKPPERAQRPALQRPCAPSTGTNARQPEPPDVVVILDPRGPEEVEAMAQRLAALLLP